MKRIDEFDSLRGLMALWVVAGHVLVTVYEPRDLGPLRLLAANGIAVEVFIILSGFVIFALLERERTGYLTYITRRFMRLFPAYLACLLVALLLLDLSLAALQEFEFQTTRNQVRVDIFEDTKAHWLGHLLAHLTLLHGVVPNSVLPSSDYAFIGQAWSISLEWQFYLVAPPLFLLAVTRGHALLVTAACAVVYFGLRWKGGDAWLPQQVPLFLLGAASRRLWHAVESGACRWPAIPGQAAVAGVLAALLAPLAVAIWLFVLISLLARLGCESRPAALPALDTAAINCLRWRPLIALGQVSYSLYLVHVFPIYLALGPVSVVARGHRLLLAALLMLVVLGASLLASALLYRWVELPGMRLGARLAERAANGRRAAGVAAH